jgi:3-oxoacyl-[acyl-carrier-protein] synthase-3
MTGTQSAYIRAIAEYLPETRLTNESLASEHPDWDVPRLAAKTGITERRVVAPGETASDLAFRAAQRMCASAKVDPSSFDYLLYCTQSPDYLLPATACVLQDRLGLPTSAGALDFNQGCSGYVYGLQLATALIAGGQARNVLLLTGETYSRYMNPADRTVRVLFGDGASATWISSEGPGARLMNFAVGTDGRGFENLIVPAGGARTPRSEATGVVKTDETGCARSADDLFMNGREVFNFTLQRVPEVIEQVLGSAGVGKEEVSWFIFHQANEFMNDHLMKKLKVPREKTPLRLRETGNTVSATIPLVLTNHGHKFAGGDKVLLVGFGVGYSWGAGLVEWGDVNLSGDAQSASLAGAHA